MLVYVTCVISDFVKCLVRVRFRVGVE